MSSSCSSTAASILAVFSDMNATLFEKLIEFRSRSILAFSDALIVTITPPSFLNLQFLKNLLSVTCGYLQITVIHE